MNKTVSQKKFQLVPSLEFMLIRLRLHESPDNIQYTPLFDNDRMIAIVKFIHENALPFNENHPCFEQLLELAENADVPLFLIRYVNTEWFEVTSANLKAREYITGTAGMNKEKLISLFEYCRIY
ncbi:hypothetical protein FACS18942_07120 [Planctomycetales bacterium]|nr:hypothetical protein FACS18942_07120 [Planctomycetales bacterium]